MPKLTDKQRKQLIADYVECGSYNAVAKKYKVSATTVKKWVLKDTDSVKKCEDKKEQNTQEMLKFLDSISSDQQEIVKLSLKALKTKLKQPDLFTSVKDIVTVFGIIYDKAIKHEELKIRKDELKYKQSADKDTLDKLDELLEAQKNAYMDK